MPPVGADATQNTPLAPSVEKAYYRKCIELKRRLTEVEEANDAARLRKLRLNRAIMKMRLERAFLLEQLAKRVSSQSEDKLQDSQDRSPSQPTSSRSKFGTYNAPNPPSIPPHDPQHISLSNQNQGQRQHGEQTGGNHDYRTQQQLPVQYARSPVTTDTKSLVSYASPYSYRYGPATYPAGPVLVSYALSAQLSTQSLPYQAQSGTMQGQLPASSHRPPLQQQPQDNRSTSYNHMLFVQNPNQQDPPHEYVTQAQVEYHQRRLQQG